MLAAAKRTLTFFKCTAHNQQQQGQPGPAAAQQQAGVEGVRYELYSRAEFEAANNCQV